MRFPRNPWFVSFFLILLVAGCGKDDDASTDGPRIELNAGEALDPDITFTDISANPVLIEADMSFSPDSNWSTAEEAFLDVDADGVNDFRFEILVTNLSGMGISYSAVAVESFNQFSILSRKDLNWPSRMASGQTLEANLERDWAPTGTFGFLFVQTGNVGAFPGEFTQDGFLGFRNADKEIMGWVNLDISQFRLQIAQYAFAPVQF